MADLDIKALADRARVVQSYIDQERSRVLDLISAVDDREFLIYCVENSWTAPEISRAREMFDQFIPLEEQMIDDASQRIPDEPEELNPWD